MAHVRTLEIRYSFWRVMRYFAIAAGALALSWYLIEEDDWTIATVGWIGLLPAGLTVADALWCFYALSSDPAIILSLESIDVYGASIPWSSIHAVTAQREFGASTIDLHFVPGDADNLKFDLSGRIARWAAKAGDDDGLLLSAFALQVEHDELVSLIETFFAETHRTAGGTEGSIPLDAPALDA